MSELQDQAVRQHCKTLRMPTIGGQFARLAEAATREGQSHVGYLEALLSAEMAEREGRAIIRLLHAILLVGEAGTGKTPGDGVVRRCMPPAATGAVHHGNGADQRTGRGGTC